MRNAKPFQRDENIIYKRAKIRVACNATCLGLMVTPKFIGKMI